MASSTTNSKRILKLKSSDGITFDVEEIVLVSTLDFFKNIVDIGCNRDDLISVPNVNGEFLTMIIEWCKKHAGDDIINNGVEEDECSNMKKEIKEWDAKFVKNLDQAVLYHLLMAADYLGGKQLLDLLTQKAADMIKGKKYQQIRQIFNIENDFTPEQEEDIKKRNPWAFE
ncbi:hypothetical protein UlMin_006599 [Ulmus minor]